jgi:hypothetical protein
MNYSKLQDNPYLQRGREKWFEVLGGAALVAIMVAVFFFAWQLSNQRVTTDYEGRVVDRWAYHSESEQGSRPQLRLMIESPDGKRFPVEVDTRVYDSARVGMRIKSTAGQVVLMDSEPARTAGK